MDWDIICLGLNAVTLPVRINKHCFLIDNLVGSHALIFRNIPRVVNPLIQTLEWYDSFVDYGYTEVIRNEKLKCYLVYPFVAKSMPRSVSSIRGGSVDDTETQEICEKTLDDM